MMSKVRDKVVAILYAINNWKITVKVFIWFIIFTFFSFIIFYTLVYKSYYNTTLKQAEVVSNQIYETLDIKLTSFINGIFSLFNNISSDENLSDLISSSLKEPRSPDDDELKTGIEDMLKSYLNKSYYVKSIRLYINNKRYYATKNNVNFVVDDFLNSPWYEEAYNMDGNLVFIPTYDQLYEIVSATNNKNENFQYTEKNFSFARLIKNNKGQKLAILVIDFGEYNIFSLYNGINLSKNSFNILSTNKGEIFSSSNKNLVGSNVYTKKYLPALLPEENGSIQYTFAGEKYLIVYNSFFPLNWKVLTYIPVKNLVFDNEIFNRTVIGFILLYIVSSIVFGIIMTYIMSKPVKRLLVAIDKIKSGDFSSRIKVTSRDEIGTISTEFNEMADSIETLLKENYIIKLREKDAQIKALQSQINPHFLYNTLDTISWKVMLLGGEDVNKIITSLGQILRYSINQVDGIVSLEQDIHQIKSYLYILQIRYEDRFSVHFRLHPETLKLKVHKLLIQPIVENAIRHGLEDKEDGGILCISSKIENNVLLIKVFDNGKGIPSEVIQQILGEECQPLNTDNKSCIGVGNVHQRIKHYYGEQYGLTISSRVGKYTCVILKLPVIF